MATLKTLLAAGNALLAPPAPLPSSPPDLLDRLRRSSVLVPWRDKVGWREDDELDRIGNDQRNELVLLVGRRCLDLCLSIHQWLSREHWPLDSRDGLDAKDFLLGTADFRLVRLLLAHATTSYLLPLTLDYVSSLPNGSVQTSAARLSDSLSSFVDLLRTPHPPVSPSSNTPIPTVITQTLISYHFSRIILSTVVLAWTPTTPPATHAARRTELIGLLGSLPPTQALASLATALKLVQNDKRKPARAWTRSWPGYVEGAIGSLMSGQMQRPGGVRALMENVFGEAGNLTGPEAVETSKLEHIAGLLSRVPRNLTQEVYIPRLLTTLFELIAPETSTHPIIYTHTACYVVHYLWNTVEIAKEWLQGKLHVWLADVKPGVVSSADEVAYTTRTLAQLVIHSPPSPAFTDFIIGPILAPLFALHATLASDIQAKAAQKRVESSLGEDVALLLTSWGKVVSNESGVNGIWSIVTSGRGWPESDDGLEMFWEKVGSGAGLVYGSPQHDISLVEEEIDLVPDPTLLARLLKHLQRADVSSNVFLKVLDEWRVRANADDQDPYRSLLFLRLTLAMMEILGEKLLSQPEHVLGFVEGVLNDEVQTISKNRPLVEEVDSGSAEVPEIENMSMVETAVSLLLASLEANEKLNHASAAILHPINAHLEALSKSPSASVRQLANEALLVLLVRRSASVSSGEGQVSPNIATYRRALTLVADPILPVRAHGLVLLRDLVLSKDYDPALTPSIMDVYMQSIQDNDSYIYLNAVKGLAAMADALGKDIFRTLVRVYRDAETVTEDKLDKALRIGEALGMVIRRSGKAFVANADVIVPTLMATFPNAQLPTILRTSSLSLLSTCTEVDFLPLLPWADELTGAVIDLIQIESVVSSPFRPEPPEPEPTKAQRKVVLIDDEEPEEEEVLVEQQPRIMDDEPTGLDSKHPALRRAAVVFLGLLVASLIEASSDELPPVSNQIRLPSDMPRQRSRPLHTLSQPTLERTSTVLRYVAQTDVDEVVRGQASEVVALVSRLRTLTFSQGELRELLF